MLHLATDRIDDPHLERETWAVGRRRSTRRRGLAACALAASLTAGVIVAVHATGGESAGPAPATHGPSPSAGPHVWPTWDPQDVDSLPRAPENVAPALPDRMQPPAGAPLLAHDPVAAAVAVTVIDGTVQVLGTDGAWRTVAVPGVGPNVTAVLSPAGTRLVVKPDGPDVAGTTVVELATGRGHPLSAPPDFRPFDASWTFVDERT